MLNLAGPPDGSVDWLSYSRVSIARSGQDRMGDVSDILVLIVRHALDALQNSDQDALLAFANTNSRDKRALLRRLALYAYAQQHSLAPDALLDRARTEGWPRDIWLRPELYLVLRAQYSKASEEAKRRLIADLQSPDWWGEDDG